MGGGRDGKGARLYKKTKWGYERLAEYKSKAAIEKDFEAAKNNYISILPMGETSWDDVDPWEDNLTYIAFTEDGNRAYEMDRNGNLIRQVNPADYPQTGLSEDIGGFDLDEALKKLQELRESNDDEPDIIHVSMVPYGDTYVPYYS